MSEGTQRRLAAIVSADVVGYSRLMGADEAGTLQRLNRHRSELIDPLIEKHGGRIVKTTGDGLLLEFPSVVAAVECSISVQEGMVERNSGIIGDEAIRFRVGIHLGDVIVEGDDIFGDGVNIASRVEGLSDEGGVAVTDDAYRQVRDRLEFDWQDSGEHEVKNIARPVQVWRWSSAAAPVIATSGEADSAPLPLPDKPSIAVLPFDNMSGDPDQEYFSDGITEDIITALSKYRWFFVSARNSTFTYKGEAVDIQQVGRDLGVRYVLEGSIRKAGDRVRVTAQLIEAETRNHIWAERYDGKLADIFDLQDEIQQAIVTTVEPELASAEHGRSKSKPPENLDAWDLYHQGMWHLNKRTAEDAVAAAERFAQAVSQDAAFARAYAGHAWVAHNTVVYGWCQDADVETAKSLALAQKAFRLDERDPVVRFVFGRALAIAGDPVASVREHRAAIEINPNFASCYWGLAEVLLRLEQPEEALVNLEMAVRLSPRDPMRFLFELFRGRCIDAVGQPTDAEAAYQNAINLNAYPQVVWPDIWLTDFYMRQGRIDDAQNIISGLVQRLPGTSLRKITELMASIEGEPNPDFVKNLAQAGLPE